MNEKAMLKGFLESIAYVDQDIASTLLEAIDEIYDERDEDYEDESTETASSIDKVTEALGKEPSDLSSAEFSGQAAWVLKPYVGGDGYLLALDDNDTLALINRIVTDEDDYRDTVVHECDLGDEDGCFDGVIALAKRLCNGSCESESEDDSEDDSGDGYKEWLDENVVQNSDGTFSTQDALYRNRLKEDELKEYFRKEFL